MSRFVYSSHKTRAAAEFALEDYFAAGDVCQGEHPQIIHRNGRWVVEIDG